MTAQPRRLYRSPDQRVAAGVCGGLADYLNMDPTLVRVVFAVLTVLTGGVLGLVAYAVGAVALPERPLGDHGRLASRPPGPRPVPQPEPRDERA